MGMGPKTLASHFSLLFILSEKLVAAGRIYMVSFYPKRPWGAGGTVDFDPSRWRPLELLGTVRCIAALAERIGGINIKPF